MPTCKSIGCCSFTLPGRDFCEPCESKEEATLSLSEKYPEQYKSVGDATEIDAFAVHQLFQLQDPSGCLQHASRKLLMSGTPVYRDIREARDTLTRWLQLNQGLNV
jgi:hypothetical protein